MEPDLVLAHCPRCRGEEEHAVLKASGNNLTVRCTECGDVRTFSPPHLRTLELGLIVSDGERSWPDRIETPTDETIHVGDEFEHAGHRLLVTAIEGQDNRHHERLVARDVRIVQAKVFDTVALRLSVNEGDVTHSFQMDVPPEMEVHIGQVMDIEGRRLAVKTLKSDQNRTLHRGFLLARNVTRAFCDPAPRGARPGDIVTTRPRGRRKDAAAAAKGRPGVRRGPKRS